VSNAALHREKPDTVPVTSGWTDAAEFSGFTSVLGALQEFTGTTGKAPLALGGWVADDLAVLPPVSLVESMSNISARLSAYTYMRELGNIKRYADEQFASGIRMDGQLLTPEHIDEAIARVFPLEPPSEDMPGYAGPCRERSYLPLRK
jgi:hypothetical protein